ncbi:MAG: N-methyl-L-tryptophan oxidase [Candidatus Dormibacteraceae bacterium]
MSRTDPDVAIVGTGTMGSIAAWQLAKRGVSVLAFEQFRAGHDRGAAGGESRIFRTAYFEDPGYVPILLEAQRGWRELERESGRRLLTMNGGLTIGRQGAPFVANVLESVQTYGLPHEIVSSRAAAERWPQHCFDPEDVVVVDQQAGFLRPELAVLCASLLAREAGAEIKDHCRVEAIRPGGDEVEIDANGETYRASKAIITGGGWAGLLLPSLAPLVRPRRIFTTWWPALDASAFVAERFPIFIRERGGLHVYGIPTIDGVGVKLGLVAQGGFGSDPDHLDRTVPPADLSGISEVVQRWFTGLYPEPCRIGVYQDGYSPDQNAILGPGSTPGLLFACGFSGHGFKMAPAIGSALADLIVDGKTELPVEHLSPTRFDL